jgi:hypothetical protein
MIPRLSLLAIALASLATGCMDFERTSRRVAAQMLQAREGVVIIEASASDNVGVTKVEFYVDGILKCTSTAAPYSCPWRVTGLPGQVYQLQTKAYDAAGNVGTSASVMVSARN